MTYEEKLAKLVRLIHKRTSEGAINWEFSHVDDRENDIFTATLGSREIKLSKVEYIDSDGDPMSDIELSIYDPSSGRVLESVRDTALSTVMLEVPGYSGWYSLMATMYESARRKTTGAEDAVNELISQLDDELSF